MEFSSVNMDAWHCKISVACDAMEFDFILLSSPLVWSTPNGLLGRCGICMHQHSTSGIRRRRIGIGIRIRRWHYTYWHICAMRGCGLTSLVVCINDGSRDIREKNVTIRSEMYTMNIRSVRCQDIREWVILWKLILRSSGCVKFCDEFMVLAHRGQNIASSLAIPVWIECCRLRLLKDLFGAYVYTSPSSVHIIAHNHTYIRCIPNSSMHI